MRVVSRSVRDTLEIGRIIAGHLKGADIICLFGQLGSGKTVFTKGIGEGLGIRKDRIISSSFILIRQYTQGSLPLYHFDLYRLNKPKDIAALGCEEYFYSDAVSVVEWADRLGLFLPKEYLKIELHFEDKSQRTLKFSASGRRYEGLLKKLSAALIKYKTPKAL